MPEPERNLEFWRVLESVTSIRAVTGADIAIFRTATESQRDDEKAIACGMLLKFSSEPKDKELVLAALTEMARRLMDSEFHAGLLRPFLLLTGDDFKRFDILRGFVLASAESKSFRSRGNAILVLETLARDRDEDAILAMRRALDDPHPSVRTNAQVCLERALGDQRNE